MDKILHVFYMLFHTCFLHAFHAEMIITFELVWEYWET